MNSIYMLGLSVITGSSLLISGCNEVKDLSSSNKTLVGLAVASSLMKSNRRSKPAPKVQVYQANKLHPSSMRKIAILVDKENRPPVSLIEGEFTGKMLSKGFVIADRANLKRVMDEIGIQNTNLTPTNAARLGKILNISSILVVTLSQNDSKYSSDSKSYNHDVRMQAKVISVENSRVLWSANHHRTLQSSNSKNAIAVVASDIASILPNVR